MKNKKAIVLLLIVIVIGIVIYHLTIKDNNGAPPPPQKKQEVNALSFYHWWISPGESAAVNALIDVFADKYPGVAILPISVAGRDIGGGSFDLFNVIQPMIMAGEAPDAFQMNGGYSGGRFLGGNYLEQIDNIWEEEGLEEITPPIVQDISRYDGHYYAVPVNIHRTNVVWYNKKLLDENNIDPAFLTSWDAFFKACDTLQAAGVAYPVQMAAAWTAGQVFEGIIAGIGIDFYEDWINGKVTDPQDPKLLEAFEIFKKYLSYANPDSPELAWNAATNRVITGEGAFNIMGDWNNGEFKAAGLNYGVDYGVFAVPGTRRLYGLGIDTFQRPKGIAHPTNADRWLRVVVSKEGQDAFNPLKGSISARLDSDVTKYDNYQKSAIRDFWSAQYMYPTISNGVPVSLADKIQNTLADFIQNPDVNKAASEIADFTNSIPEQFTRIWILE